MSGVALQSGLPSPQQTMPWDSLPSGPLPSSTPQQFQNAVSPQQNAAPVAPKAPADPLAGVMAKIASGESGGDDNARYGFPDLPGAQGPEGTSHALRKYQFEPSTWENAAREWVAANPGKPPPDFNRPQDEENVARFWASKTYRQNTGRDLAADAAAGKVDYSALAGQWPSLGKPSLKASWTGQLSPEERRLMNERTAATDANIERMTALGQQYADTANAAAPGSKQRDEAIAQLQENSAQMQREWRQKMMNPPVATPVDSWKNMGSAGFILAALAGLLSKQHMTAGLTAAGAALNAINKNSQDEFNRQYQIWKDQVSLGAQMISMENEDISQLLADKKMAIEEKQARLSTLDHELGIVQAIGQQNIGNIDAHEQFIAKREQTAQAFQMHMDTLDATVAYRQATLAQKAGGMANAALDPNTLKEMADQYLAGDKSVLTGLGYGNAGAANRAALRQEIQKQAQAKGMSGTDIATALAEYQGLTAGERSLGTRTATMGMAVSEARQLIPQVLQTSAAVNRTNFPSINDIILAGEKGTGDPNVVRLGIAINSFINVYARAISPTGVPTVSDKDHARELLDAAWSNGQIEAGMDQIVKEMNAAGQAPGAVRQEFREGAGSQVSQPQIGQIGGSASANGVPVPAAHASDPDGTRYQGSDGKVYVKQGGQMVPQ